MCGIFGIWNRDGAPVDIKLVQQATNRLNHRGPDDEGYLLINTQSREFVQCRGDDSPDGVNLPHINEFAGQHFDFAFGFRRLAILDTSPAGHQPMVSSDGRYWMIFNGEVYNYVELRETLQQQGCLFHSGTDTEVVLESYAKQQENAVSGFNGMWAFAVYDTEAKQLFLCRDRFGIKPLYRIGDGQQIAFASEIKALIGIVPFEPNDKAIYRLLTLSQLPDPSTEETFFANVHNVPPAHYIQADRNTVNMNRYWDFKSIPEWEPETDLQTAIEKTQDLFTNSVRLRLRSDVPVGTSLSGGLDSSSVVSMVKHLMEHDHHMSHEQIGSRQKTFSAVYHTSGHYNEIDHIKKMVDYTGTNAYYTYPSTDRLLNDVEKLIWHQDEPFLSTSIFAQWCVMSLTRETGVTVLLDGQGADEMLAGYRPFELYMRHLLKRGQWRRIWSEAKKIEEVTGQSSTSLVKYLARHELRKSPKLQELYYQLIGANSNRQFDKFAILTDQFQNAYNSAEITRSSNVTDLDGYTYFAMTTSIQNLLRYEDRNSMAFSIEARVPFLDVNFAEYVVHHLGDFRIQEGWTKWIFRKSMEDKLPQDITWRRDKVGYETPENIWIPALRDQMEDVVCSSSRMGDYIDMNQINTYLQTTPSNKFDTRKRWLLYNLAIWFTQFSQAAGSN